MKRLVPFVLSAVLLSSSGCHMFSKKKNPAAPKESKTLALDDEKDFMQRWIDKRTNDLVTQGMAANAAHDQAVAEFKATYTHLKAAQQAK
jgi:hypothetical protein